MPFTPFHLGPALGFGLPLRNYLHVPTFLVASILVDLEPFLVLSLRLDYPLHGFLHTFILAFILGLTLGYAMFLLERILRPLYKTLLLESNATPKLKSFIVAGVLGTMLHVLLDSPLYDDIRPFYPLLANPLYHLASSSEVYGFCMWMGILGIAFYLGLLIFSVYRGLEKKGQRTYPSLHALLGNTIRRYRKKPIRTKQIRSTAARTPASTPMKKTSECARYFTPNPTPKRSNSFVPTLTRASTSTHSHTHSLTLTRRARIDFERRCAIVNNPEKNGKPRAFKASEKLLYMLNALPKKNERVFGRADYASMENQFVISRKRTANKLQNPRILQIHFHTLRHWKATMEYHKTKDILNVMNLLGHRNIESILVYTHLISCESDEYHSAVAKTVDEARKLLEEGFEYVCQKDDLMLFRKMK